MPLNLLLLIIPVCRENTIFHMSYDAEKAGKNQNKREERHHKEEHQQESQGTDRANTGEMGEENNHQAQPWR